jgi:cellulose biosynthesis protein BcsQ
MLQFRSQRNKNDNLVQKLIKSIKHKYRYSIVQAKFSFTHLTKTGSNIERDIVITIELRGNSKNSFVSLTQNLLLFFKMHIN